MQDENTESQRSQLLCKKHRVEDKSDKSRPPACPESDTKVLFSYTNTIFSCLHHYCHRHHPQGGVYHLLALRHDIYST